MKFFTNKCKAQNKNNEEFESKLLESNGKSINDDNDDFEQNVLKKTERKTLLASRRRKELIEKVPIITNQSLK